MLYREITTEKIKYRNTIDEIGDIKVDIKKSTPKSYGKSLQKKSKNKK
jgi:hypothetical protein